MTSANFERQLRISDTPKRGASNRARHDYDGRVRAYQPSIDPIDTEFF